MCVWQVVKPAGRPAGGRAPKLLVAQQPPTAPRTGAQPLDRLARTARALGDLGELLERPGDQPAAGLAVVDREARAAAGPLRMGAQQPVADGVEGAHRHPLGDRAEQHGEPAAQLGGGAVGERDHEQRLGRLAVAGHQRGGALGQHAGLAGAGAG